MNRNERGYELESATTAAAKELELVIQRMAERENDEREKLSKRYVGIDEKEAAAYERGFSEGYEAGRQKGLAEGIDIGLKQAAKEEERRKGRSQTKVGSFTENFPMPDM